MEMSFFPQQWIALVAQFLQLLKTRMILTLNFTWFYAITNTLPKKAIYFDRKRIKTHARCK